jgi:Zn-dependent peptidase ImmA (M78 family)
VNPAVLTQAREVGGLDAEQAAARLKLPLDQLLAIENGAKRPSLTLLRRMAAAYALPLGTLLMPEPLEPPHPPEDMRTVGGQRRPLSEGTLRTIRQVRERQELAQEIVEETPDIFPRADLPQLELSADAARAGESERRRLTGDSFDQLKWRDAAEAFRSWRALVESLGILVFAEPMERNDARGFSLIDHDQIPVIVVNSRESSQARNFTLFHEYAHLLLRNSALCLEIEVGVDHAHVERFCNQFSAGFLMPAPVVRRVLDELARDEDSPLPGDLAWLGAVAARMKVSRQAAALRLQDLEQVSAGFYERVVDQIEAETWAPRATKGGGPRFSVALLSRLGSGYPSLVLDALRTRAIDLVTASEMLNAPAHTFEEIGVRLRQQAEQRAALS